MMINSELTNTQQQNISMAALWRWHATFLHVLFFPTREVHCLHRQDTADHFHVELFDDSSARQSCCYCWLLLLLYFP